MQQCPLFQCWLIICIAAEYSVRYCYEIKYKSSYTNIRIDQLLIITCGYSVFMSDQIRKSLQIHWKN